MQGVMESEFETIGKGVAFRPELSDMLEAIAFFKNFCRQETEVLATYVASYRVAEGTALIRERQQDGRMYFIISGRIDLYKEDADGSRKKLASVRAGSILGEMGVIDNHTASATAITAVETEVVVLTHAKLLKLCSDKPIVCAKLLWRIASELSARLRKTSGSLITHLK